MKRKSLKQSMKLMNKAGEELKTIKLSDDPKIREAELKLQGIAARVKKEGITSA